MVKIVQHMFPNMLMSNSFGFAGINTSIVIRKRERNKMSVGIEAINFMEELLVLTLGIFLKREI